VNVEFKKAIGIEILEFFPIDFKEYCKKYDRSNQSTYVDNDGYMIKDKNGTIKWVTKALFESKYLEVNGIEKTSKINDFNISLKVEVEECIRSDIYTTDIIPT
jgi:hypothetical protein